MRREGCKYPPRISFSALEAINFAHNHPSALRSSVSREVWQGSDWPHSKLLKKEQLLSFDSFEGSIRRSYHAYISVCCIPLQSGARGIGM
jgi:hypothetical protein